MTALLISLLGIAILSYVACVFWIGGKIQDYCISNYHGEGGVAFPWIFAMFMILVLPAAIIAQLCK